MTESPTPASCESARSYAELIQTARPCTDHERAWLSWVIWFGRQAKTLLQQRGISKDEEKELRRIIALAHEAHQRMVVGNLRLAASFACRARKEEFEDRMQDAILGLIQAIERFDPRKGTRFSTYAWYWLQQSIQRSRARSSHIRLPPNVLEEWGHFSAAFAETNDPSAIAAIAAKRIAQRGTSIAQRRAASVTPERVVAYMRAAQVPLSLDAPLSDKEGRTLGALIAESRDPVETVVERRCISAEVLTVLAQTLSPQQREAIVLRFYGGLSMQERADRIGVPVGRLRSIESHAIRALRKNPQLQQIWDGFIGAE